MDGRSAKRRRGDAYRKTKGPVKIAGRSSRLRFRVRARCTLSVLSPSPRLLLVSLSSLFFFFLAFFCFLLPALDDANQKGLHVFKCRPAILCDGNNNGRSRPCAKAEEGEKQMCSFLLVRTRRETTTMTNDKVGCSSSLSFYLSLSPPLLQSCRPFLRGSRNIHVSVIRLATSPGRLNSHVDLIRRHSDINEDNRKANFSKEFAKDK